MLQKKISDGAQLVARIEHVEGRFEHGPDDVAGVLDPHRTELAVTGHHAVGADEAEQAGRQLVEIGRAHV